MFLTTNLFGVDENGDIVIYGHSDSTSGDVSDPSDVRSVGSEDEVSGSLDGIEIVEETADSGDPGTAGSDSIFGPSGIIAFSEVSAVDGQLPVLLSEEVTQALLSLDAASGSLSSSTLDYFDRVVSGLPDDYTYVAYRTSADDSYSGVLYYGEHVVRDGNVITFLDGQAVEVVRNSVNYASTTTYSGYEAEDVSVTLSQSGTVLYYSNALEGYPVLGGMAQDAGMSPYIVAGLMAGIASTVLGIVLRKR